MAIYSSDYAILLFLQDLALPNGVTDVQAPCPPTSNKPVSFYSAVTTRGLYDLHMARRLKENCDWRGA